MADELHALFEQCKQVVDDYFWRAALRGHRDAVIIVADLNNAWAVRQLERLGFGPSPSDAVTPEPDTDTVRVISLLDAATAQVAALLGIEHYPHFQQPPVDHYRVLVLAAGKTALILVPEPLAALVGPSSEGIY